MGWWSIVAGSGDGISLDETGLHGGDGPADILDDWQYKEYRAPEPVVDELIREWQECWGRDPFVEELEAACRFTNVPPRQQSRLEAAWLLRGIKKRGS